MLAGAASAAAALVLVTGVGLAPANADEPGHASALNSVGAPGGSGADGTGGAIPGETATPAPTEPGAPVDPAPADPAPAPGDPADPADPAVPIDPSIEPAPVATPDPTGTATPTPITVAAPVPPAPTLADPNRFVCWGDSLSYHVCDPSEGNYLQNAFGGDRHVVNAAMGGQNSSEIATRMGAHTIRVSFPGNSIPASGSASVQISNLPNDFNIFISNVWIHGVQGRLEVDRGFFGGWTFTRSVPGQEVSIAANTPVHILQSSERNHPGMIWVGRNNVQQPDQIIADVAAMVATHRATSTQPIWIVGMTPSKAETNGTVEAGWINRVNSTLHSTYGQYYIPMDNYLRDIAMRELGLAMTAADRAAVSRGVLPPSLTMADGMHFNGNGRRAIANYIAANVNDPANDYLRNFDPQGSQAFVLDRTTGVLQVVGWGFDKSNVFEQLSASVSLNGAVVSRPLANRPSPYLAEFGVPGNHAFWTAMQLGSGQTEVCVTFHDIGAGNDLRLPCRVFDLPPVWDGRSPHGDVSMIFDAGAGHVTTVGWAYDNSHLHHQIPVRVTINGQIAGTMPTNHRTDYLAAYGVPGAHGFVGGFSLPGGTSRVCVIALDMAPGRDTTLKCESFTVSPQHPEGRANVTMNHDGSITVRGHAFDRANLQAPIDIAVFQNNQLTTTRSANSASPELYPYGVFAPHGINVTVNPITRADSYSFCVLAVNIGRGESQWLGCWNLDSRAISPVMAFSLETDSATGGIAINGWAFDSSVPLNAVPIVVRVDGHIRAQLTADQRRSELATIFGWPGDHGFSSGLGWYPSGSHQVCVTAFDLGRITSNTVQCQTVTV